MGFRFQKRLKIMPGVTLNLSKSGVSTSVGTKGARATFGHGKTRTTLGIPGSGLSHTEVRTNRRRNTAPTTPARWTLWRVLGYAFMAWLTFKIVYGLNT